MTRTEIDNLSKIIIGCAIDVHKELGPGLLEKAYERALIMLLEEKGLKVESQVYVPVEFRGVEISDALKLDIIVNDLIIVEIKSVTTLIPVHEAQLLTYLKLMEKPKGILINFYCNNLFYEGQKTLVNKHYFELENLKPINGVILTLLNNRKQS